MSRLILLRVATTVFGMATVVSAGAQTISIGSGPLGSITNLVSSNTGVANYTDGNFSATAADMSSGADLGSTLMTFSVNADVGTTYVWMTETDVNIGPTPQQLLLTSGFTQNNLPAGASVTETTYFDASGAAYGTGTTLASATFNASGSDAPITTLINAVNPYSITEEYAITFTLPTAPTALSTISLTTTPNGPIPVVPELSIWMMMGLGFAGLGLAGYGRSRKPQVPSAMA
jgi:hypothetical protein